MPKDLIDDSAGVHADPRARRSRARLMAAARSMVAEEAWEGASVAAICRRAGVARSSFYEHMTDRDDLLQAIVAEALTRAPVELGLISRVPGQVLALSWLAWHLRSERALYRAAFRGAGAPEVAGALRRTLLAMVAAEEGALADLPPDLSAFLVGGVLSEARDWLMADPSDPTNDLADRLARVTLWLTREAPVRDASAGSSR